MYTTGVQWLFRFIEESLKNGWRIIEDSLKNRQGLKERPFVFDTFWQGKVKTSISFDGIWPLLSIFWPLFDARHQISVKSWSQNERFLVKTWWFLTSERKLLQVSSNFQIENQAFATIERKLPELSSKFLPGFAAQKLAASKKNKDADSCQNRHQGGSQLLFPGHSSVWFIWQSYQ